MMTMLRRKKAQTLIFRLKNSLIKSDVASKTLPQYLVRYKKPASKSGFFIRQM